jgi:hypothetical protein
LIKDYFLIINSSTNLKECSMLHKIVTILIVLSLLPIFLYAQESTRGNKEVMPVSKFVKYRSGQLPNNTLKSKTYHYRTNLDGTLTLLDTLFINPPGTLPASGNSNFGFFGHDRMTMWFIAPADLYLKEVGFDFISINQPPPQLEVKIVNVSKPVSELEYMNDDWWGWFEALGGDHDATCFWDDPDRTGNWIPSPQAPDPDSTFGTDIWSDGGVGQPFIPDDDTINIDTYQFVDLSALGYPDLSAGTVFAVALKNLDPLLGAGKRVGILGPAVGTGGTYQYSLQKYYADANTNANQCPTLDCQGLWSRDIALSYAAIVEIYGNTPPDINSFTHVGSDVNLGPFPVDANITDANPGDPGNAGVASAYLRWSVDGGAMDSVMMTNTSGDIWSADIPAQSSNTTVTYSISAFDVTDLYSKSTSAHFYIFQPSGANTLVIFNGFDELTGFPQDDYFGPSVSFEHDSWNYGAATTDLLNNYDNVIEIWNENYGVYNDDVVKAWIGGDPNRNYCLAGQEYLGAWNGYDDTSFVAGDFIYDILGIDSNFNDISYYSPLPSEASVGDSLPTLVMPQSGTLFGTPLLNLLGTITPTPDSLMYNPLGVYQTSTNLNWQDAFHVLSDVVVDMTVETRGMGAQWKPRHTPIVRILPTMAHRTLPAGNKIVFQAYDPISLTTANDDSYPYWYWVGNDTSNSVYQALKWFGIVTDVNETGNPLPTEFSISQNYPNPFNPTTAITYTIPEVSRVTLKVYDILGEEVATLVNEDKSVGNYVAYFDASKLASGMYIYTITAGQYTASKKMMLLK